MNWFRKIIHNVLGWHYHKEIIAIAGINVQARCKTCGYEGQLDSQGNLF